VFQNCLASKILSDFNDFFFLLCEAYSILKKL